MSSLKATNKDLSRRIELAGQSVIMTGLVTAVDPVAQTCTVTVDVGLEKQSWPALPLLGNYLPTVGHDVTILLGGDAPIVMPPTKDVVTGVRGRVDSTVGDNLATNNFEMVTELITNGTFESTVDGWVALNATLAQTAAQAHSGTKSMSVTSTGTNVTMTAEVPVSTNALSPVAQYRWYGYVVWARSAVTTRAITLAVEFYDAALTLLSTISTTFGNDATASWTQYTKYMTAPAGAVWARPIVNIGAANVASGEVHYLDDVSFSEAVIDFDPSTNAKVFTFDSNTESWTSATATLVQYTGLDPSPIAGAGALSMTSTVNAAFGANSPTGTSGVPCVAGFKASMTGFVRMNSGPARNVVPQLFWYTAAGAPNGSVSGSVVAVDNDQWYEIAMNATAPAGTAFAATAISCQTGAVGNVLLADTVLMTQPTNTLVYRNTNATYVRSGTVSMAMKNIAGGVANVLTPPGADATYAWPVTPGDFYAMNLWYKNDAGNGTRRAVLIVASWYSSGGTFVGTSIGTYPVTTPGAGWINARERFLVPANAAFMRANVVWIGAANDIVYIDDFEVRQASHLTGKFTPETSIDNLDFKYTSGSSYMLSMAANTWTATAPWQVVKPLIPVRFAVIVLGDFFCRANSFVLARVGISFDGGLSYSYGPQFRSLLEAVGTFPAQYPFHASHEVTGTPTDNILYRFEANPAGAGTVDTLNYAVHVLMAPAPPAGQQ